VITRRSLFAAGGGALVLAGCAGDQVTADGRFPIMDVLGITPDVSEFRSALRSIAETFQAKLPQLDLQDRMSVYENRDQLYTTALAQPEALYRALSASLSEWLTRHGADHAVVVSSVGADARAGNFYLRTKGRMERDLSGLEFARCDFLHPGLLLGERDGRHRFGESLAQKLSPIYNPLLAGPLRRYRSVSAEAVAKALVKLCLADGEGVYRHEFDALSALAAL